MIDPRMEDHVLGLELQLVELVEQRERATVQHRTRDAARIQREIEAIQEEMAGTAEAIAGSRAAAPTFHAVAEAGAA